MPPRPDAEADGQSRALLEVAKRLESDATHRAVASARAALPASRHRAAVLSALAASRVCVVTGGTGCGKSTQVPQMILEEATRVGVGGRCAILCSQPRRISAVGLAQRVAEERGERVGDSVGYAVRLESRRSAATRLLFCTTGVLLRALVEPGSLRGATHVVVDEVHERSVDSDLLLLLLKGALRSHPALRVVLMSATADPGLFSGYFAPVLAGLGEAPPSRVDVPGFTHPVRELFLEDCLELTGQAIGRGSKGARKGGARGDEREAAEGYSAATRRSVANAEEGSVNYAVLEAVVAKALEMMRDDGEDALLRWEGPEGAPGARFHCHGGLGGMAGKGAVLVFLPGVEEIRQAQRLLAQSARVRGAAAGS